MERKREAEKTLARPYFDCLKLHMFGTYPPAYETL